MNDQAITCRFVFTGKQHGRALGCYWRHSRSKWLALVCIPLMLGMVVYSDLYSADSAVSRPVTVLSIFLDCLPVILFYGILFVLIWFFSSLAFRRTAFFGQELVYTLDQGGVHMRSAPMNSDVNWVVYGWAVESSNGFALFQKGGRTFAWLPKEGFDGAESIARCRELLRQKVKDGKKLAA